MAAPLILVDASPRHAATGAIVPVRLAGGGAARAYPAGYRAGLAALPRSVCSLNWDGEQLGGGGVARAFELTWSPADRATLAEVAALFWADAAIVVRAGAEDAAQLPQLVTGRVLDVGTSTGALSIALADELVDLKRPVLTDRFAGTGELEGPAEWAGQIKSRAWGRCFNLPGRVLDQANNIICFGDPGRAWHEFVEVRDRGVAATAFTTLAWQGSGAATLAALRAAAAPAGGGVWCPSLASVKWWTEPAGELRADVRGETAGGYVETAPEIAARIVGARSTLAFAPGELARAVASRPAPFGWRIDSEASTAADEISRLLGDVSLSWLARGGELVFRAWEWSAPVRSARSVAVSRRETFRPVATRKLGYRRNWAPLQRSDLAAIVLAGDVALPDGSDLATAFAEVLTELTATQSVAAGKSTLFYQPAPPTAAQSAENDRWIDTAGGNREYRRAAGSGVLAIGGSRLLVAGASLALAPWLPASDVRIDEVRATALQAQAAIAQLSSDDVLSPVEKPQFAREWQAAQARYAALDGRAASFGNVVALRTALTAAYTALASQIAAISPPFDNFASDSPVAGATLRARWSNFYTAYAALDVAITAQTLVVQWSVSGAGGWHADYAAGDKYQRQSVDGGATFGAAAKVVGEDGAPGPQGIPGAPGSDGQPRYTWVAYADSVDGTANFTTGEPGSRAYIGFATNRTTAVEGTDPAAYAWSLIRGADGAQGAPGQQGGQGPQGVAGQPGADGQPRFIWVAYADSADGTVNFTNGEPGARTYIGVAPNKLTASESTAAGDYSWARIKGDVGATGQNGQRTSFVFQRAASQPATPTATGTPPPGWADAPPPQTEPALPLWQSQADFRDAARLSTWSAPIKLTAASLADLDPTAAAVLAGKGKVFSQGSAPSAVSSQENDLWINPAAGDATYRRLAGSGVLAIGGNRLTIGGSGVLLAPWAPVSNPEAARAAALAAAALAQANAAAADSVLTPDEKRDLAQRRDEVIAERDGLVAKASVQGLSSTAYQSAYAALVDLLGTLNLTDRGSNTAVDPTALNDRFTGYYTARTALVSATGDLTAANQVVVSFGALQYTIEADYQGNVTAGLPLTIVPRVARGGFDIRTLSAITYAITATNLTAAVDNIDGSPSKGTITITGVSANSGTVDLVVRVASVAQAPIRLTVTKRLAGPPVAGGSTAKLARDDSLTSTASSTFAPLSDPLTVGLAAGERLIGTAAIDYQLTGEATGQRTVTAKWQYRPGGTGAWSDFGAPITGTATTVTAAFNGGGGTHEKTGPTIEDTDTAGTQNGGYGNFSQAVSGLAEGAYEVQLVAALNLGGRQVDFYGAALIEAKP